MKQTQWTPWQLIWLSDNCMGMQVIQILTQFLIMQNIIDIFVYIFFFCKYILYSESMKQTQWMPWQKSYNY
jgi:hypothetical protein